MMYFKNFCSIRSFSATKINFGVQSAARPVRADFCVPKKPRHSASRWRKMWYRRWKRMQVFLNFRVPPIKTQRVMRRIKKKIRRSNAWVQNYFGLMLNRFMPNWNLHMLVGLYVGPYLEDELIEKFKFEYGLKLRHLSSKNLRRAMRRYEPRYWDVVIPFPRDKMFSLRGSVFFMWSGCDLLYFLKIAKKELLPPKFIWKFFRTGYSCLWVEEEVLEFFVQHFVELDGVVGRNLLIKSTLKIFLFSQLALFNSLLRIKTSNN